MECGGGGKKRVEGAATTTTGKLGAVGTCTKEEEATEETLAKATEDGTDDMTRATGAATTGETKRDDAAPDEGRLGLRERGTVR